MEKPSKGSRMTVGLDLGDRFSHLVVIDEQGQLVEEGRVVTSEMALRQRFAGYPPMRIALETGTHSPWVSRVLEECGNEVVVANSRKLRLIYENPSKDDRVDAMYPGPAGASGSGAVIAGATPRGDGAEGPGAAAFT